MGRNTYGNKKAAGGGINQTPHGRVGMAQRVGKAGKGGKTVGASKAPLPKQKQARGTGIAGRGTRG